MSTLPVDFILHKEKSKKDYGLTKEECKNQFHIKRRQLNPDDMRAKECNKSKMNMAIKILRRA